uniref:Thyroid hormone receptor associated protein 3 n=1 Tax=Takifugu rubripes TaxID=31033 RepID=H2TQP1_TAKRU
MKKHNCSRSRTRSRSRSRSHSPPNNREKNYQRSYQNSRNYRGYIRGGRRPFNFRGRGRGFFPRGHYQRGGGGYNNHNFRPNWKNYKQNPQKKQQQYHHHQQQQQQQQQNYSQGRPQNYQSSSRSPPRDASHHSDRSPTPLSRHSRHSSSSSHNSSPKFRQNCLPISQNSKDVKEKSLASKVVQKEGGGDGETEALVVGLAGDAKEDGSGGKTEGSWQTTTNCSSGQNQMSPLASSAAGAGQNAPHNAASNTPTKMTNAISNGGPSCEAACSSFATKKASQECLNSVLSSFFSNEDYLEGDKNAISIAFGKFLEEQNKKAKALENGNDTETKEVNMEQEKVNGKPSTIVSDSAPEQYNRAADGSFSMKSILKASPFLSPDGEDSEEPRFFHNDDFSKVKSQAARSARDLFSKRPYVAYSQAANSDAMTEDLYLSQKQEKMAGLAAALREREAVGKFDGMSADVDLKARKMAPSSSILSPSPRRRNLERELFTIKTEDSPFSFPRTSEAKINVRADFLRESLFGLTTAVFTSSCTAQHFPPCEMTLNERFTMYHRRAAEKEIMKPRKSPEIHRRIDVSPRAFKKHSQLFEAKNIKIEKETRKIVAERRQWTSSPKATRVQSTKSKKRRSRSSSSSSSSSSSESQRDELPFERNKEKSLNPGRAGEIESPGSVAIMRPQGGFQVRIRGRGWNRGSFQGNASHSNNLAAHPNKDEWDPEFTPKSRKYYLHDDRDGEVDLKCTENRGRGDSSRGRARFIIRKATSGPSANSPKWAHKKFGINVEDRAERERETQQDHRNERESAGERS